VSKIDNGALLSSQLIALRSELEEEKVVHGREVAEVRRQLVEREGEVQQARMEIETQVR